MVDELGLVGKIDALIPQDLEQRHVSVGMAVKAMILIGLGFVHRALYLTPHFFQGKPVERLLGSGITAEQLNDDVLGRALDAIYAFGVELFYYLLASAVVKQLGLTCAGGHLDATSFHVDGEYNSGNDAVAEGVIHIRPGYSRDHRPDLNQVVLQLITENQAGIPLLMVPLGGNVNDQAGFRDTVGTYVGQLQTAVGLQYLVADSALYNEKSLQALGGVIWVSRVPETLGAVREIILAVAGDWMATEKEMACCPVGAVYG
jgi:transposase